ncbi:hypothetical protein B0H17DRAFT_1338291 [Mycena rosella]|uniref:Glycosyl transferase CAP10 domain-containing protein n=1 Tax=Mycena rosella TaxID=1033263 RepID=A0AAD7G0X1_MYCRO|nr:hypothetical protein B0H17DRAFT_1338291 [Mycena rosella]
MAADGGLIFQQIFEPETTGLGAQYALLHLAIMTERDASPLGVAARPLNRPYVVSNEDRHPFFRPGPRLSLEDPHEEDYLETGQFPGLERRARWISWIRRTGTPPRWAIPVVILVAFIFLGFGIFRPGQLARLPPAYPPIAALYARQSSTLEQAMARYSLRNGRPPPPMYSEWYKFARTHSCLIDDYEQISRDFEPFYQLARDDPAYFGRMVIAGSGKVKKDGNGMKTGMFSNGKFSFTDTQVRSTRATGHGLLEGCVIIKTLRNSFDHFQFAYFMPNMNIILNGRDEPRVVFDPRHPGMRAKALNVSDRTPFEISPHPTASFFEDMHCLIPNRETGLTEFANNASAFMLYSSSTQFTTDLYPVMSMTKISPCFADILVPSEFYYSDSGWTPRYSYPNHIPWANKTSKLYWRGMSSGGWVYDDNYHAFPRFRVVDIGRNHPHLMDVALSAFHDSLCGAHCDAAAVKAEYAITGSSAPREEVYKYKYLFDVDGNSFSGRYLGLLRSGSLVFKTTVFTEYFSDWLRPFEHYIPRIEWAIAHEAEAYAIQQAGEAFATRVITDAQNDCYFSAVLLEWGHLQAMAEEVPSAIV